MTEAARWAWAEVDLDALAHNVGHLRQIAEPADLWAVVKADGYGHGAVEIARAALTAGAQGLAVALTQEGAALRSAGIDAPILILSEQPHDHAGPIVEQHLTPTVCTPEGVRALASAVAGRSERWRDIWCPYPIHIKLDTGMHRVGARPGDLAMLLALVGEHADLLRVDAVFTHLAVADEPANPYTGRQLDRFDHAVNGLWPGATHAANSAGFIAHPRARRTMVRAGIALYGIAPGPDLNTASQGLHPVLSLHAKVSYLKRLCAGDALSYGLRYTLAEDATIATVPIGYADGVPRRLFATGGCVLIGGRRCPIVGAITMDQLMVDCGDLPVRVGDTVVMIGSQGHECITASEWAERLGTIAYEIVCGISARVPRRYVASSPL